jgi:Nif-specific regulatory protein
VTAPTATSDEPDADALRRERDLYLRLLSLGQQIALEPLLHEALALVVEVTEAHQGYLELYDDDSPANQPRWWIAHGFSRGEIAAVRGAISKGIIAEAIASGRTIATASAKDDPQFRDLQSVRLSRIEAVVCAPVGADPPRGVLYLQGQRRRGMFSESDVARAEIFARHLAPFVDHLAAGERRRVEQDPTRPFRDKLRLEGVIGHSAALAAVFKEIACVAPLNVSIVLAGESGTGKSHLARLIHENSPRAHRPFVELNCATIRPEIMESELFGHRKGAFTGADRDKDGLFTRAEGGTMFLDEISEIPISAQAKLLQVLQSGHYRPLAQEDAALRHANVRVIAATNTDLPAAVAAGRFREDLYYRINVVTVRVPSLAERRGDVVELAVHLCGAACSRHELPHLELSGGARRAIETAEWPGNIRQLEHAVELAAIRCAAEGSRQIERHHVFPERHGEAAPGNRPASLQEATRSFQAELLRQTLEETEWNVLEAAQRLDIARSHVYRLMHAFGIERGTP